jgi:hypothetical protein
MRIRTIKPEFFHHEELHELETETSLPIRLAFIGLWCAADREGRFKWSPKRLGVQILPYDDCDFSRVLDALATRGFIRKYACGTELFGVIPTFLSHQVINNRERESELPQPLEYMDSDACSTRDPRVTHASKAEGKGKEGNKEQGRTRQTRATNPDFKIPETLPETLKSALADWKRHRSEIRKPITPTQWVKLVEDGQADPARMAATIRNSILSGYQGLFPEKVQPADMVAVQTTKKLQLPANWREIAATIYDNPPTCSEDELTEDQRAQIYRNSR